MKVYTNKITEVTNVVLEKIQISEKDIFTKASEAVILLEKIFLDLNEYISEYTFKDESEEILFFKNIKPQLFSKLIYYRKVYNMELLRPNGGLDAEKKYLKEELRRTNFF